MMKVFYKTLSEAKQNFNWIFPNLSNMSQEVIQIIKESLTNELGYNLEL